MKILNMKLYHQLICMRKFSVTCMSSKYFYERPMHRKVFGRFHLLEKRQEKSEYNWFREWAEEEEFDLNAPKTLPYTPFFEVGDSNRAYEILKSQYHQIKKNIKFYHKKKYNLGGRLNHFLDRKIIFPDYCDIVIIGGGLTGASIAYHIKKIVGDAIHVVIVDKDLSFSEAASANLAGIVKQQFSTKTNFELSQYAIQFLDNIVEELRFENYVPNIDLNYAGCLTIANEDDYEELYENYKIQRELGAAVRLLRPDSLKKLYPWLNMDGIKSAVLGISQEGWYDNWSLLSAIHRNLASRIGVDYVLGEVVDCRAEFSPDIAISRGHPGDFSIITDVVVKVADGSYRKIRCNRPVLATGWRSGELAKVFDVGMGYDMWEKPLPIVKRKRYLYYIYAPDGPGLNSPFVIDTSRIFFRREGLSDIYLCGFSINPEEDPNADNLKTDDEYFKTSILPVLSHRVEGFKKSKIIRSQAVFHDYNEFDQNPIFGYHPGAANLFIATGFGENYINALGAGNYFMEQLMGRRYSVNLDSYRFLRVCRGEKLIDSANTYLEA